MSGSFECGRRIFLARSLAGGVAALAANLGLGSALAQTLEPAGTRMDAGEPSATARGAALSRAVHQIIDFPHILDDPFAISILGPLPPGELQAAVDSQSRALRASIVMRSRYAEDRLAGAVARGVRQYVILGAGLDTFACRNPHAQLGLRVFEVDHPATQRFKRERLDKSRIALPPGVTFVPIDFETQTLPQELVAAGFRFDQPAFFSLLGVVIYLTDAAVMEAMRVVGSCVAGSEIAFSFSVPDDLLTEAQQSSRERSMAIVAALGEPWITFYEPATLANALRVRGFSTTEVFAPPDANRTYFADRIDGLRISSGHMMSARV
jgi:methyltransferase (TIGR00027 family)